MISSTMTLLRHFRVSHLTFSIFSINYFFISCPSLSFLLTIFSKFSSTWDTRSSSWFYLHNISSLGFHNYFLVWSRCVTLYVWWSNWSHDMFSLGFLVLMKFIVHQLIKIRSYKCWIAFYKSYLLVDGLEGSLHLSK